MKQLIQLLQHPIQQPMQQRTQHTFTRRLPLISRMWLVRNLSLSLAFGLTLGLSSMQAHALSSASESSAAQGHVIYADVNGLVCDFCAQALEKVFGKQDAVADIDVDLNTKVITITLKAGQHLDDATISKLITDSGYAVRAIRHE